MRGSIESCTVANIVLCTHLGRNVSTLQDAGSTHAQEKGPQEGLEERSLCLICRRLHCKIWGVSMSASGMDGACRRWHSRTQVFTPPAGHPVLMFTLRQTMISTFPSQCGLNPKRENRTCWVRSLLGTATARAPVQRGFRIVRWCDAGALSCRRAGTTRVARCVVPSKRGLVEAELPILIEDI